MVIKSIIFCFLIFYSLVRFILILMSKQLHLEVKERMKDWIDESRAVQANDESVCSVKIDFQSILGYIKRHLQQRGHSIIDKNQMLINYSYMAAIFDYLSSFGRVVDSKSGQQGSINEFRYKYLGLYFTATWCSYCVKIVDKLPILINKVNSKGQFLKLLTLRLDQQPNNFGYSYLRYKTISYDDVTGIANRLGARQIPSCFIFDLNGTLVTRNGLQDIMKYEEGTIQYWDRNVQQYYKKQKK